MADYYLDSSALCKRYVTEKGSGWLNTLFATGQQHRFFILRLTHVEFASALARRVRDGTLSSANQDRANRQFVFHLTRIYRIVEVDAALCERAALLADSRALRAFDSLQLAGALKVGDLLRATGMNAILLTADMRLLRAAQAEGLPVDNPEFH